MARRYFPSEDGPELVEGEQATGWNGSGTLWVPEHHQHTPCPEPVAQRLAMLREQAAARAEQQRKRGLIL